MRLNDRFSKNEILILSIFSFLIVFFLWDYKFIYPIKFFITAVHEASHGVAVLITGGEIVEIHLDGQSGYIRSFGGVRYIISPAGYIGCAIVGGIFIITSNHKKFSEMMIILLSLFVIIINLIYIDSYFNLSFLIVSITCIILILLAIKTNLDRHIALLLSSFFIMSSFDDVKVYLLSNLAYKSDAGILANYIGYEWLTFPIALSFFIFSVTIYFVSIRYLLKN